MALMKPAVKLILRESRAYQYRGPVLTLGVPDIYATSADLTAWFPQLTGRMFRSSLADAPPLPSELGRELGWVSADTFLRALGISKWLSLDVPGCEHLPNRFHDLNEARS